MWIALCLIKLRHMELELYIVKSLITFERWVVGFMTELENRESMTFGLNCV